MSNGNLVYRGQREISAAVGINWKRFSHYVENKGLPVFRIKKNGTWLALPDELREWILEQRSQLESSS